MKRLGRFRSSRVLARAKAFLANTSLPEECRIAAVRAMRTVVLDSLRPSETPGGTAVWISCGEPSSQATADPPAWRDLGDISQLLRDVRHGLPESGPEEARWPYGSLPEEVDRFLYEMTH